MEEKNVYKLTNNLLIVKTEKGNENLIYIADPSKNKLIRLLNMREVENNVNEAVQKYIRFLNIDNKEDLNKIKLFAFLIKVKLYIKYISRNLLGHMLSDEYEQLEEDITPAFTVAEYLLNKEPLSEENKSIIKDKELFNKLYSSVKKVNLKMPVMDIEYIFYFDFYLTLKAYQNINNIK